MMKTNYKKTLWGSLIAFFIGTSCCWMSALAIWLGGISFIGTMANYLGLMQVYFIGLALVLALITGFFYFKTKE